MLLPQMQQVLLLLQQSKALKDDAGFTASTLS
jgi:hypothetical protein